MTTEQQTRRAAPALMVFPFPMPGDNVRFAYRELHIAINGTEGSALDIMLRANEVAGRNGIGLRNALESRIIGTKSRGVYEAPGLELLGFALRFALLCFALALHCFGFAIVIISLSHPPQ